MAFNLFKKKNNGPLQVVAPVTGEVVLLEDVPDPVFSQKMMGDGVAVMPSGGAVVSPVDGTVEMVADTGHAVGVKSGDGTEFLIHIGLETVSLKGQGFSVKVSQGDKVSAGQPLIEADWAYLKEHAASIVTPIVVTNGEGRTISREADGPCAAGETVILSVSAD
ncbi:PTS sugar transporter subunit IIA [Edaphobacillus lindanitolerans]|uniref:PTS system IIA component, Glc family n=1 Tax=Edaphobacillus lindanitolerans TaxID=550447 RepID=A0A1U7PRV4_9BACI|nr:PTS glucose transporter subunit IIA [Edaphobacillus lindanitolerans]SIT87919.1 PTS system IIA component, Glc family [Edaphobacillus lindanitolerans]